MSVFNEWNYFKSMVPKAIGDGIEAVAAAIVFTALLLVSGQLKLGLGCIQFLVDVFYNVAILSLLIRNVKEANTIMKVVCFVVAGFLIVSAIMTIWHKLFR